MTAYERRTRRAQSRLDSADADALTLTPGRDCYYLTGVDAEASDRLLLLLVPADGDPTFVVPTLEADAVRASTWVDDVRTWDDDAGPDPALDPLLDTLSPSRVLLADRMWARFSLALRERL
ncbi:MAG: aminopeptidase P family N-terminal domain-containing protein, partial [Haloplanus sp.]